VLKSDGHFAVIISALLCCFVSPNISGHSSAVLTIYRLHPAKQLHLPLRKPLPLVQRCLLYRQSLSAHPPVPRSHLLHRHVLRQSRNSEHTIFHDLEGTIHSPGAESRAILLPITPNHTPVLDWLDSVSTYILIARLKAAEKVHRANMSRDAITAGAILHPALKG
jgi:hypothetical protein